MHSLRKPHCLCTFLNYFSPPWVPGLIPFYFRYKHSKRMKGQRWNRGCFLPPHLRGGKGHTGFPTLGGEYRSKGTVHTWGRSGKMLFSSGPSCLFSKKGKKVRSSIMTSDPSFRGSDGERLCWKSEQHLGFNNQTQEAFSASAHLAATRRSDAGRSMSSCRPRCLRVFPSLSEVPGSAYRISVGPATDTSGGCFPAQSVHFHFSQGKNLSRTALLSVGGEWHVGGSQVSRQEEVLVQVPAGPWPGLRHDLPG